MSSQKGFSLLEIMVAAALLGLLAAGGTKLMTDQSKAQKSVESRSEINTLLTDMRTILSKEQSCKVTFSGKNITTPEGVVLELSQQEYFPPGTVPEPPIVTRYRANSNPQMGSVYGNGNVRILGYSLSSAPDPTEPAVGVWSALPAPSVNRVGTVQLKVRFYIGKKKAVGSEELVRKINLNVEIRPDNTIERCSAIGSLGVDGRYLHRESPDDGYRTMQGNLIIADPYEILLNSDVSLKYDIRDLKKQLPGIRELRPVSYKWKSRPGEERVHGLIAQEVQRIYPELVSRNNTDGTLNVNYIQLLPILLAGVREVDAENKKLQGLIRKMERDQQILKNEACARDPKISFCKR